MSREYIAALATAGVALVLLVSWLTARRLERIRTSCPNCGDSRCAGCE